MRLGLKYSRGERIVSKFSYDIGTSNYNCLQRIHTHLEIDNIFY